MVIASKSTYAVGDIKKKLSMKFDMMDMGAAKRIGNGHLQRYCRYYSNIHSDRFFTKGVEYIQYVCLQTCLYSYCFWC